MSDTSIIGIDVSKSSLDICIKNDSGLRNSKIANSYKDITKIIRKFKNSTVFYETTGIYSNKLCKACNDFNITHYQVNPFVMCKIYDWLWDRNKTDRIDSKKIAQAWEMLLRMYESGDTKFKLIFPSSNRISEMNHYVSVIHSLRNQISRFKQLLEKLDQDIYTDKKVTRFYKKQLKVFQEQQSFTYDLLQNSLKEMWYSKILENIWTIPTINTKFGAELVAFFLKLSSRWIRKEDRSKLKAFVGIDPNEKSSGTSLNKVHISRKGSKSIRCMFFMAGMKWYQLIEYDKYRNTDLGEFFIRMREKFTVEWSKHGKRVIMAMSKKLLLTAWWIFWKNEPYDWRR